VDQLDPLFLHHEDMDSHYHGDNEDQDLAAVVDEPNIDTIGKVDMKVRDFLKANCTPVTVRAVGPNSLL